MADPPEVMSENDRDGDSYRLRHEPPTVEEFIRLRSATDMAPRSREALERGLPNTLFGVTAIHEPTGETVGMGRVVGDDGTIYHVNDVVVHPDHQRRGIGTRLMTAIVEYIEETAPPTAFVNLFSDVDGFYERFGFEETRPDSKGMFLRVE